jgi:hypothetical protein
MTNEKPDTAVVRYDPSSVGHMSGAVMEPDSEGDYVRYSDYAALQARVAELEAQTTRAEADVWREAADLVSGLILIIAPRGISQTDSAEIVRDQIAAALREKGGLS